MNAKPKTPSWLHEDRGWFNPAWFKIDAEVWRATVRSIEAIRKQQKDRQ